MRTMVRNSIGMPRKDAFGFANAGGHCVDSCGMASTVAEDECVEFVHDCFAAERSCVR